MAALILTAFVLFIAGGCIALLGDRLGTYVGKKRISKFGLRPRETAKLYTFFSGATIALLVMLLLILLNHQYLQAIQERTSLKRNIAAQHRENALLQDQIRRSQAAIVAAALQVTRANEDLRQAVEKKGRAEQALRAAQKSLAAMQGRLSGTQTKLAASQAAVAARQRDLSRAQAQFESVNGRLRSTSENLRATMNNLNATVDDLGKVRAEAKKLNVRNQSLRTDNENLVGKNGRLAAANAALILNNAKLTQAPVIDIRGGEVGRTEIDATQTPEAIQKELVAWLDGLSARAQADGASVGPNDRAIVVVNPPTDDPRAAAAQSTEKEIISAVVDNIVGDRLNHPSVAVIALAKYNTAVGEQVRVELHPYQNTLIFHVGQVIRSTTIDGTKGEDEILKALQSFLTYSVQPYVIDGGVIPKVDPKTGQVTAGQVVTNWVDIVREIRAAGAGARVDAVAVSDTTSIQPLPLRLVVSPDANTFGPGTRQ